jgi:predicted nucleic acid-binding protein
MTRWVADASPLLFLAKLDRLNALRDRATEVLVPRAVFAEVLAYPDQAAGRIREASESWLRVVDVEDRRVASAGRTSRSASRAGRG